MLTEVLYGVAGLVKSSGVELQPDDGEDDDGKHDEEPDLHEGGQGLQDGLEDDLEAWGQGEENEQFLLSCFSLLASFIHARRF